MVSLVARRLFSLLHVAMYSLKLCLMGYTFIEVHKKFAETDYETNED